MFEAAELGHQIDKDTYKAQLPALREALLDAQYDLKEKPDFPVLILINGVDGAGKGETVNLLNEWLDPRLIDTHAFSETAGDGAGDKPAMWRYWQALPGKGRIGILFGSWYSQPVMGRVTGELNGAELQAQIDDIIRFETMLANEGVLLLKFWFHLGKRAQKARLTELEKDPLTRWRVGEQEWAHYKHYDKFRAVAEGVLLQTSTGTAPWIVVDGSDTRYRSLTVSTALLQALRQRLDQTAKSTRNPAAPLLAPLDGVRVLDKLKLDQAFSKADYREQLEACQGRLNSLSRHPKFKTHGVVAVFEGNDAAGKGGAIRRVTAALDARHYQVIPVAAPSDEERAQPYLWRFWRRLPAHGSFAIFDRSWYGRVLVERVEGFAAEADWMRAYAEINDFEQQLNRSGLVVVKFWLAIDADEQLKRFKAREETGFKRFKITAEDWRNRDKWDAYREAVHDMVERTSTPQAPWVLVEANNKYHARIKVLNTLCAAIEARLG